MKGDKSTIPRKSRINRDRANVHYLSMCNPPGPGNPAILSKTSSSEKTRRLAPNTTCLSLTKVHMIKKAAICPQFYNSGFKYPDFPECDFETF